MSRYDGRFTVLPCGSGWRDGGQRVAAHFLASTVANNGPAWKYILPSMLKTNIDGRMYFQAGPLHCDMG